MAGNANSGRKRKPTAKQKLDGTYRKDRHQVKELSADGVLVKPDDLGELAGRLWDSVEPQLVQWGASELDSVAVADMCRWWGSYRELFAAGKYCDAARCWDRFNSISARYGMTLADRMKLEVRVDKSDELEAKHFGVVG